MGGVGGPDSRDQDVPTGRQIMTAGNPVEVVLKVQQNWQLTEKGIYTEQDPNLRAQRRATARAR